jgi:uncharacterized protein YigE (DUF2233 family)
MLLKYYFIISIIFCTSLLIGQGEMQADMSFNGDSYDMFKVKIDKESISKFGIFENRSLLTHNSLIAASNDSSFFMMNAGITDSFCAPLGYYVNQSKLLQDVNLNDGKGNFYLKPNGALLMTTDDIVICESSMIKNYKNVILGIQSGPMLLNNGIVNSQFNPSSQNKNIRCGVGLYENQNSEKFLVFCISNNPVSFYSFSQMFLTKMKCTTALCLESGSCVINLPYLESGDENSTIIICNYIYFGTH